MLINWLWYIFADTNILKEEFNLKNWFDEKYQCGREACQSFETTFNKVQPVRSMRSWGLVYYFRGTSCVSKHMSKQNHVCTEEFCLENFV